MFKTIVVSLLLSIPTLQALALESEIVPSKYSESFLWAHKAMHIREAWQMLAQKGIQPGFGVRIAIPDTGISPHPELDGANVVWEDVYDFVDNDHDITHEFTLGQLPPNSHGTSTLGLIASLPGCQADFSTPVCVDGVAYAAEFLPLRAASSVVLGNGKLLAKAIDHAVRHGAHIISISMAGFANMPEVQTSIRAAREMGVIVIAAAGNVIRNYVFFPGALPEVITVAGVTEDLRPWIGSSSGPAVDVSAPAYGYALSLARKKGNTVYYSIVRSMGTSDAAALVAGSAALWLSYHGRDTLVERYGLANLPSVFQSVLVKHGVQVPHNWPMKNFGAGIVDAEKLLMAPLP